MLRYSQYFNLEPLTNGDSTVVLYVNSWNPQKIQVGDTVSVIKTVNNSQAETKYIIHGNPNKTACEQDLGSCVFRTWRFCEGTQFKNNLGFRIGSTPAQYKRERKIKPSILRNHFREIKSGELVHIQTEDNNKFDDYKNFAAHPMPKEFLFKMFDKETMMFLGPEMKPLKHEDYHTNFHNSVALERRWSSENFLHLNFLIGQRKISYSELDFLYGDLFVDSFCYSRGKLYTNKNKKVK
jgi:hypothetical protein